MKKGYREQIDVAMELRGVGKQQSLKKNLEEKSYGFLSETYIKAKVF